MPGNGLGKCSLVWAEDLGGNGKVWKNELQSQGLCPGPGQFTSLSVPEASRTRGDIYVLTIWVLHF